MSSEHRAQGHDPESRSDTLVGRLIGTLAGAGWVRKLKDLTLPRIEDELVLAPVRLPKDRAYYK